MFVGLTGSLFYFFGGWFIVADQGLEGAVTVSLGVAEFTLIFGDFGLSVAIRQSIGTTITSGRGCPVK